MSHTITQSSVSVISALRKMREGILFLFIAWIFLGIGIVTMMFTMLIPFVIWPYMHGGWVVVAVIILVVGVVLAFIGFYSKFIPGVSDLARVKSEFSTASSLIKIGYVWGLMLVLIGAILTLIIMGVFIAFIGIILLIIGHVGMIILCFKLNYMYKNTLYLIAGIFFILNMFMPILGVVSWILIYVALGDTIMKLQKSPTQTQV